MADPAPAPSTPPVAAAVAMTPDPAPSTPAEPPAEKTVPYDRFQQVNETAKQAKKQLEEMQARLQELEDKDKSELERERTQRERLEAERNELGTRLVQVERGSWIRDAAVEAKFIDPADALGRVNLAEIESESDARKAVKKIAEQAKHLIQQEAPPAPQIGQVVRAGQTVDPNAPDPAAEENQRFLNELKEASSKGWSTSTQGLVS